MAGGAGRLIALVGLSLLLSSAPNDAIAQVFIASQPKPDFTIGPLFVRANVGPKAGPIDVIVLFSAVPATAPGKDQPAQDLYLLWPGTVDGETVEGAPDPELRRAAEARGFQVAREGRRGGHTCALLFNRIQCDCFRALRISEYRYGTMIATIVSSIITALAAPIPSWLRVNVCAYMKVDGNSVA